MHSCPKRKKCAAENKYDAADTALPPTLLRMPHDALYRPFVEWVSKPALVLFLFYYNVG
jgi:hypothetical protein